MNPKQYRVKIAPASLLSMVSDLIKIAGNPALQQGWAFQIVMDAADVEPIMEEPASKPTPAKKPKRKKWEP